MTSSFCIHSGLYYGNMKSDSCFATISYNDCRVSTSTGYSTLLENIESLASTTCNCSRMVGPGRNVPLQWLVPQFGMASLCLSAHSLELFLRHSFLNLRRFYLVVLGLGAPLSSPT